MNRVIWGVITALSIVSCLVMIAANSADRQVAKGRERVGCVR